MKINDLIKLFFPFPLSKWFVEQRSALSCSSKSNTGAVCLSRSYPQRLFVTFAVKNVSCEKSFAMKLQMSNHESVHHQFKFDYRKYLRHLILTSKMRMGCEALSFLLEQMGNCQPSYQLKDSVIESKRPFSNVILLCIFVFKCVSNGLRDYAIANPQSWNNLIFPNMQMCEIFAWHCWHRQWD